MRGTTHLSHSLGKKLTLKISPIKNLYLFIYLFIHLFKVDNDKKDTVYRNTYKIAWS